MPSDAAGHARLPVRRISGTHPVLPRRAPAASHKPEDAVPKDLFDLSDVSDLPRELRPKKQGYGRRNSRAEQIFRAAGRPLTNSEFRIAYFRRFGVAMAHNLVGGYLSTNARRGLIVRVARGVYALPEHLPATPAKDRR
jgi:hypothetical protein